MKNNSEYHQRLENLAASMPGVIVEMRMKPGGTLTISYISGNCREKFGLDPIAIQGDASLFLDLTHPDDSAGLYHMILSSAKSLTPFD